MEFDIADFVESLNKGKKEADDYLKENEPQDGHIDFESVSEQLTNENLITLFEVLNDKDRVRFISFRGCDLGDEKANIIIKALIKNETITSLDLSANNLTDEVGKAIGSMLFKNKTLIQLFLSDNLIGDKGATNIAQGLKYNTTLKSWDLNNNQIKKAAICLVGNTNANRINLADNELGDNEVMGLAKNNKNPKTPRTTTIITGNGDISRDGVRNLIVQKEKDPKNDTKFNMDNTLQGYVQKLEQERSEQERRNKKQTNKKSGNGRN